MNNSLPVRVLWAAQDGVYLCRSSRDPRVCLAEFILDLRWDASWTDREADEVGREVLRLLEAAKPRARLNARHGAGPVRKPRWRRLPNNPHRKVRRRRGTRLPPWADTSIDVPPNVSRRRETPANPALRIPRRLSDDALLTEIFEGHCTDIFARHRLVTVRDLVACKSLSPLETYEVNAWLDRCWWYW
jgi:hypothetical protein